MSQAMIKKLQLGIVSLSTLALLAACGDGSPTQEPAATDDPAVQEPAQPEDTTDDATDDATADVPGEDEPDSGGSGTFDASNGIWNVEFTVTFDQAVQLFYDTFGEDVNIDEIDFDSDRNVYEYSISGWDDQNEYDLDIDAESGDIREQETDRDSDNDNEMINMENIISPQEAMDSAIQDPDSDIIEGWKLEVDDGMSIYEIDFEGAMDDDIKVNAETGDIVDR